MKFQYDGYIADEALKSIGGEHVCRRLETIACDGSEKSRNAVNILCELRNEKALPVLRKIISSAQAPAQTDALCAMARLGTPEDIPLLVRKSD